MSSFNVIITAGGLGTRMKSDIPKQFLSINGKPILMYTIEKFYKFNSKINIILVLPKDYTDLWKTLCKEKNFLIKHKIVIGGETRFESIKNGLNVISENGYTATHDGVRPFVSFQTIQNCLDLAKKESNAIPVVKINDSIRRIENNNNFIENRELLRAVSTPQIFETKLLKTAYNQEFKSEFTDCASVVEKMGIQINLTEGNSENIKITNPSDLIIAEVYILNGF